MITAAFASETLNAFVNAAVGFSAATFQQLAAVRRRPDSPQKTVSHTKSKTAYFKALREAVPELMNIATAGGAPS